MTSNNGPHYAEMARRHWEKHFSERVERMKDPEAFFAEIGEEAALEIEELARNLEEQHRQESPPGTSFLRRAGQMLNARQTAESTVLRRLVLLDPETEPNPDDQTSE